MSPTLQSLGIDHLTSAERIRLVEEIWDSIPDEDVVPALTEVQQLDLRRRIAEYEADPKLGSTWEEVKARLRAMPLALRREIGHKLFRLEEDLAGDGKN